MERITPRSFLILIICTIFLVPGLVAQLDRPFASGLPNSFPQRNFNGQHVGLLNLANRQMRSGRLEEAIMSYNAALAQQPNWVPALVGRAGVLTRVGRHLEAQKDLILANRINPTATDLLFTNNSSELLFFLALYPATEWPAVQGATNSGTLTSSDPNFSYIDYFQSQYDWIAALPDSLIYAPVLRNKVSRDLTQASQILNEVQENPLADPAIVQMLGANLKMINQDYLGAITLYNRAINYSHEDWPELIYNRGLAYTLLDNYANACEDFYHSAQLGFTPAEKLYSSVCNF